MIQFLWICLGGAVGTGARFLISSVNFQRFGFSFPWGTLLVNVLGSFLLVFLVQFGTHKNISPKTIQILGVGVMGGFTTYSTFNYDVFRYAQESNYFLAGLYLVLTLVTCLIAGYLGFLLSKTLAG